MSINRGMAKKMWCTYAMEYYDPAIKKNEIVPFAEMWVNIETVREKTIQDSTLSLFQWLVAVVHRREVVRTSGILLVNGLVISRK